MNGKITTIIAKDRIINITRNGENREHRLSETCKVFLNGQEADLGDLKIGDDVTVDGQPAVKLLATRPTTPTPEPVMHAAPPAPSPKKK